MPIDPRKVTMTGEPSIVHRIARGRVHVHFPDIGLYLVALLDTTIAGGDLIEAYDLSSQVFLGTGTMASGPVITIGTPVVVLMDDIPSWNPSSRTTGRGVILGVDNLMGKPNTKDHPLWRLSSTSDDSPDCMDGKNDEVRRAIVQAGGINRVIDRSAGRPLDLCDGDWIVYNALKAYLSITGDRVSMAGGPMSGLHFFPARDTCIFNTGTRFLRDSMCSRETVRPDGTGFTSVSHMAATGANAVGSLGQFSEAMSSGPYRTMDEDALPIWRHQNITGKLVSGSLSSINVPAKTSGLNKGEDDTFQPSVASDYSGYDGSRTLMASHSATLTRDPLIPTLNQLEDEFAEEGALDEPEEVLEDIFTGLSGETQEYASQYADLMYELMKRKFVERYWSRAKTRTDNWKALTADEICEKVFGKKQGDPPLQNLSPDEPCYKVTGEDIIEHTDPVTGDKKVKSTHSPAYVHLSPSGAVVISDGTGAELRLEGGNITLTCPGDIKMLPGRDLTSLVPRYATLFSQDRLDIASDKGEVAIKSKKGTNILATEGPVTVEGLKDTPSSAESMDDRKENKASGVVIRSASSLALLGSNIRMGLQTSKDTSTGGRSDATGALVIDAGKGSVAVIGSSTYIAGKNHASMTTEGAGIGVTGTSVGIGGDILSLATSKVGVGGSKLSLTRPEVTKKGIEDKDIKVGGSTARMSIQGTLMVSSAVGAQTITSGFVRATTVGANNGSKTSGIRTTGSVSPVWTSGGKGIDAGDVAMHDSGSKTGMQLLKSIVDRDKLFTAAGTLAAGLYYPTSEDYHSGPRYFIAQSRWQRKLKAGGGGYTWSPEPVKNTLSGEEGLPRPGKESFDGPMVGVGTVEDTLSVSKEAFKDAYVVNAQVN